METEMMTTTNVVSLIVGILGGSGGLFALIKWLIKYYGDKKTKEKKSEIEENVLEASAKINEVKMWQALMFEEDSPFTRYTEENKREHSLIEKRFIQMDKDYKTLLEETAKNNLKTVLSIIYALPSDRYLELKSVADQQYDNYVKKYNGNSYIVDMRKIVENNLKAYQEKEIKSKSKKASK